MDKKTLTAFVLIFLIAIIYPRVLRTMFPDLVPPPVEEQTIDEPALTTDKKIDGVYSEKAPSANKEKEESEIVSDNNDDLSLVEFDEKIFSFESEEMLFNFSNRCGSIQAVDFLKYPTSYSFTSSEDYILGLSSVGSLSGLENLEFVVTENSERRIVLESVLKDDELKIEKILERTDKEHFYTFRLRITNNSQNKYYMKDGPVINAGSVIFDEKDKRRKRYAAQEATAFMISEEVQRIKKNDIEGSIWKDNKYIWVGIQDPTVCFIFMEKEKILAGWNISKKIELFTKDDDADNIEIITSSAKLRSIDIAPMDTVEYEVAFYAGPKLYYHLASIGEDFNKIIDFGKMLAPISRTIIWGLNKLYSFFHNYGICIIILTIMIKIMLYPLTHSSMKSMKRMKDLQPHMDEIREQYKSDPQKMNREVMALYKKHKVNPLGGCLPMFLQLPIFFALFKTLNNAVELNGASFLWIKDLSAPDAVPIGPYFVNILPLIMGVTQFISQKQTITDKRQAQMMMFMPILFTFIFYNMPSGLVLYWLISNVLSIIQQSMINKKG